jgi:acyl carrier protein
MTSEGTTLRDELIVFIVTELAASDEPIDQETDLLLTGQVDSLGVMRIVGWLEERCDIEIDPVDVVLENFQSVGDMVAFVERSREVASG